MTVLSSIPNGASLKDVRDTLNSLLVKVANLESGSQTPTPPAPAFTTPPSIAHDGTPTVGEVVILNFGTITGDTIGRREIRNADTNAIIATVTSGSYALAAAGNIKLRVYGANSGIFADSAVAAVAAAPAAEVHKLLTPIVQPSQAEGSASAAFQVTLPMDAALPESGYLGFALKLERATNAAFTQGYAAQTNLIETPTLNSGDVDYALLRGLVEDTTYYFRFVTVPPSDSTAYSASDPSVVQTKAIPILSRPAFSAARTTSEYAISGTGDSTITAQPGSSFDVTGQHAIVAGSKVRETGRWWLKYRVDVVDPAEQYALVAGVVADGGTPVNNDANAAGISGYASTPPGPHIYIVGQGVAGDSLLSVDSEVTLAANEVAILLDTQSANGIVAFVTFYQGAKKTAPVGYGNNVGSFEAFARAKPGTQITLMPEGAMPPDTQNWNNA